jgi:hypothetical protein
MKLLVINMTWWPLGCSPQQNIWKINKMVAIRLFTTTKDLEKSTK